MLFKNDLNRILGEFQTAKDRLEAFIDRQYIKAQQHRIEAEEHHAKARECRAEADRAVAIRDNIARLLDEPVA